MQTIVCPFVLFHVAIVLSVLLQLTASDYTFGIFKLFSEVRIARSFVWYSEESLLSITHSNARVFAMTIRHLYVSQIYVVSYYMISWIYIVLVLWNKCQWVDMSLNSKKSSWFWANQSLHLHLNDIYFVEKGITHSNARVFVMKIRHFYVSQIYVVMIIIVYEKHLNIQKVIRCRQSKKDREYNRKRRKRQ
jgi:hypothetical protein